MTIIAATDSPDHPTGTFGATLRKILAMSWPIMLGALSMSVLNLGQIGILGNIADPKPLYSMSILQPYYLLFFAFLEALAITSQVFSARSQKAWKRGNIRTACLLLAVSGMVIIGALVFLVKVFLPALPTEWTIAVNDAVRVLAPYLFSLLPYLIFEIINGALRGEGKTLPGFVILALSVAMNLAMSWVLVFYQARGLDGIFAANAISGSAATLAATITLLVATKGTEKGPLVQALMRLGTLLAVVGAPVFLSLVVSFVSSSILIDKVAGFGKPYAAGFVIVVRLRYFFLIPAIAMATSMAVLVNQDFDQKPAYANRRTTLVNGFISICLVYVFLTAGLYALHHPLINLVAADPIVREASLMVLDYLFPSFFMVGLVAAFQLILENLGKGARVLIWTIALEAATCAALLYWAIDITTCLFVLIGAAVVYTLVFGLEYASLVRRSGRPEQAATSGTED